MRGYVLFKIMQIRNTIETICACNHNLVKPEKTVELMWLATSYVGHMVLKSQLF